MVTFDIPVPPNCLACPCSYCVQSGEHEGKWMCNALEYKHPEEQDRPGAFVLDGSMLVRPKNCPIMAEPARLSSSEIPNS